MATSRDQTFKNDIVINLFWLLPVVDVIKNISDILMISICDTCNVYSCFEVCTLVEQNNMAFDYNGVMIDEEVNHFCCHLCHLLCFIVTEICIWFIPVI